MSDARRWTIASAAPDTVYAATTSASGSSRARMRAGVMLPWHVTSTNASVPQPSASGSTTAVNPRRMPVSRSRSTRRFTAGADRPTTLPISA